jgi:hypothetical protein
MVRPDRLGHGAPGVLHQVGARGSGPHCRGIGLSHFVDGQNLQAAAQWRPAFSKS